VLVAVLFTNLTLTLLVPGVRANDVHLALAADDLAILANPLDAGSNLHGKRSCGKGKPISISL
jgi:hypothetical protein